ncbi:MAG: hypothetical protein IT193_05635 [Propionibacteriaceae bacterium]|nr:hypothetical protein [Propionibacteriaceae bacterium]
MRTRALLAGLAVFVAAPFTVPTTPAQAAADGCAPTVKSDFNGDNRTDTVVGDPFATVDGVVEAGRLIVLYGDADGLVGEGVRDVLWQGEAEVSDTPETGDRFGTAVAMADIDCDSYTDVVVGTPREDLGGNQDAGLVQVLWGGAGGLAISDATTSYTKASFGQVITAGDRFGQAVDVVEDVGQGGTPAPDAYALAIGVPGADVGGHNDAGALAVKAAHDGGTVTFWITQDTDGIPGAAEAGDEFGAAVSCNYLSGDADTIDCAVGAPKENIGSKQDAGSVTVVQDIYFDDELVGVSLDQNAAGVPDSAEAGDFYGRSIDTILVGGTSRIAVGAPGENIGSDSNAGLVQLFSSDLTDIDPGTALTQDTPGVGDSAQPGDIFGDEVAWVAPGLGDIRTRLAVSAPKENTTAGTDAGMVQVFPTNNLGSEVTWTQGSPGVPGGADDGDRFGETISTIAGATERVLLVGVPDDTANTTGMVDVIPFGGGTPRFWAPGGGIPVAGASRFGDSLGGMNGGTG